MAPNTFGSEKKDVLSQNSYNDELRQDYLPESIYSSSGYYNNNRIESGHDKLIRKQK